MYLFGANQPSDSLNFRPQLRLRGAGDPRRQRRVWRPLNNPRRLAVSAFSVENPRGFGLMQRTREFNRYEDLDDRYELRPSGWVETRGDWGKGHVELVEIPTPDETNDNIVAFWSPEKPGARSAAGPGVSPALLHGRTESARSATGLGTARVSAGDVKQANLIRQADGSTALVVDFVGPVLASCPRMPVTTASASMTTPSWWRTTCATTRSARAGA